MASSGSEDLGTYYHHTDEESLKKKITSRKIRQSKVQSAKDDAKYGSGTYLTTKGPDAPRSEVAKNNYDGTNTYWESKQAKTAVAIELKLPMSKVTDYSNGNRSVFKYGGDVELKDAKDIKVHIRRKDDNIQTYEVN